MGNRVHDAHGCGGRQDARARHDRSPHLHDVARDDRHQPWLPTSLTMRPQHCVALSRLSVMRHEVGGDAAGSVGLILGLVAHEWFPLCGFDSRYGRGVARRGLAGLGKAGRGRARQGKAWDRGLGMVVALFDSVPEHGSARLGGARRGGARQGRARRGRARDRGLGWSYRWFDSTDEHARPGWAWLGMAGQGMG
nr:MAG TPA_asm: hypothetical protein [Caudoviricetes sp.]